MGYVFCPGSSGSAQSRSFTSVLPFSFGFAFRYDFCQRAYIWFLSDYTLKSSYSAHKIFQESTHKLRKHWEGIRSLTDIGLTISFTNNEAGSQIMRGSQPGSCLGHQGAKLLQEPTGKSIPAHSSSRHRAGKLPQKWKYENPSQGHRVLIAICTCSL